MGKLKEVTKLITISFKNDLKGEFMFIEKRIELKKERMSKRVQKMLVRRFDERQNDLRLGRYGFSQPWWYFDEGEIIDVYINECKRDIDAGEAFFTFLVVAIKD